MGSSFLNFNLSNKLKTMPKLATDIVVVCNTSDNKLCPEYKVLLIERKNEPLGLALPGGFLDNNETLEECASRELREETNINVEITFDDQIGTFSTLNRDPRQRVISTAYLVVIDKDTIKNIKAQDDAKNYQLVSYYNFNTYKLCFDHELIIHKGLKKLFEWYS